MEAIRFYKRPNGNWGYTDQYGNFQGIPSGLCQWSYSGTKVSVRVPGEAHFINGVEVAEIQKSETPEDNYADIASFEEATADFFLNTSSRPVEKEWTNFTPSISAVTTAPALATTHKKQAAYKVIGKSLHIIWSYSHIFATGATAGLGHYLFPIPNGYTIDITKVNLCSIENAFGYGTPVGNGRIMQDFSGGHISVVVGDSINLKLITDASSTNQFIVANGWYAQNINNVKIMFTAEIPII